MAQATRTELVKRHQQQQVSTSSAKPKSTSKCEAAKAAAETGPSGSKTKPSYKHIPHSQKPPHLVAKRNARERRRVKAVNEAFNTLKKCVPIQNRNKRVSKVKTLQRAIDHIRHLQALLEADNEAAGAGGGEPQRIFVSSKAGEEAELRLAMSPEPRRRATAATKLAKTSSSGSLGQQVEESRVHQEAGQQKQRRGRKPNAVKQQEAAALKHQQQQQQQVSSSVLVEQQQQQQQQANHHYLIEAQTNEYGSVPHGAAPPHYYSLPQATCHTTGGPRGPAYAYTNETPNQHQHYHGYENAAHYYQPSFHEQYQQPNYGGQFYSGAGQQVPYGDADSTTAQRQPQQQQQQQQPMAWQPVLSSSTGSSRSSGGVPLDSSLSQLGGSPSSSASLTQLMCNLNTSNSSSECSSSGPSGASCLYNGAAQHHHHQQQHQQHQQQSQRRAMPADSTTSSSSSNNNAKSASSLIDSPYSTASSSSLSSASTSFSGGGGGGGGGAGNKSLDSSAPLNLKHADKSSPTSAGGRQVNNYANNYALPTFVYEPQRQQPDGASKLIGQQQPGQKSDAAHQTGFLCGGDSASDLYLAEVQANNEHQRHQSAANYGPGSCIDFHKRHPTHLDLADQLAASERANGLYNAPTPL